MTKKTYILPVLGLCSALAAALCGCQSEGAEPLAPDTPAAIGFAGALDGEQLESRATEFNSGADLSSIGVFAYQSHDNFDATTATPNLFYNQEVEKVEGTWTYSPTRYWPGSDKVSFFAYAPYSTSNPAVKPIVDANGFPSLTFTVPATEDAAVDLLVSEPIMNRSYNRTPTADNTVKFQFKHALTKVTFKVKGEVPVTITKFGLLNATKTGTYTFCGESFDNSEWSDLKDKQDISTDITDKKVAANTVTEIATFYLLPNINDDLRIAINYEITDVVPKKEFTPDNITPTGTWAKGKEVVYRLNLRRDGIVTMEGGDWTPANGGEIESTEKGIANYEDWKKFVETWNTNGIDANATTDDEKYAPYSDWGWYETIGDQKVFTIKLKSDITISGSNAETYTPVGTEDKPLLMPIDGQGHQIQLDLRQSDMEIKSSGAGGLIGNTEAAIKNIKIMVLHGQAQTAHTKINFTRNTTGVEQAYSGVLVGYTKGDVTNCSMQLTGTTITTAADATAANYLGALVGYSEGNIYNSAVYDFSGESEVSVSGSGAYGIGGLAGHMAQGKSVSNCYVRLPKLTGNRASSAKAGWLVGDADGVTFTNCFYHSGTASGCTVNNPTSGATTFTDATTLCSSLNSGRNGHDDWKEWIVSDDNTMVELKY